MVYANRKLDIAAVAGASIELTEIACLAARDKMSDQE
jgi:hypothetical protein